MGKSGMGKAISLHNLHTAWVHPMGTANAKTAYQKSFDMSSTKLSDEVGMKQTHSERLEAKAIKLQRVYRKMIGAPSPSRKDFAEWIMQYGIGAVRFAIRLNAKRVKREG